MEEPVMSATIIIEDEDREMKHLPPDRKMILRSACAPQGLGAQSLMSPRNPIIMWQWFEIRMKPCIQVHDSGGTLLRSRSEPTSCHEVDRRERCVQHSSATVNIKSVRGQTKITKLQNFAEYLRLIINNNVRQRGGFRQRRVSHESFE